MSRKEFLIFLMMFILFSEGKAQTDSVDTLIFINPKSTYLRLSNDSGALNAVAIDLNDLGLIELDHIVLQQKGDYDNGPHGDTFTGMTGVFSFNDSLLESAILNRVIGAIEAGEDFITHNTYSGNLTTDISEDFFIDSIVIQIPDSAEYLFISPHDAWFHDNSDPDSDFGVRIAKTEVNSFEAISAHSPHEFALIQNYPNPFNPSTRIKFDLPKPETVKIEVYNIIGQKIQTLLNKPMPVGYHEVEFNGQNLSSGIYLYRIEAGGWQDVRKMVLIK